MKIPLKFIPAVCWLHGKSIDGQDDPEPDKSLGW
jgi:hypothetical protein